MSGSRLIREAGFIERLVEEVARTVARENSPSPVSAMSCRREAQNQQFCMRVAKTRDGFAPVLPAEERPPFLKGNFLTIADKSRALSATDDRSI